MNIWVWKISYHELWTTNNQHYIHMSVRCNLNTSSTIAKAGLNLFPRAFMIKLFMILATVIAPASAGW